MTNSQTLFHLWFELECIGLDGRMRLCRIPGSTCDDIEYVVGVRQFGSIGNTSYACFRSDLPDEVAERVWAAMEGDVLGNEEGVWRALIQSGFPKNELRREITYTFRDVPPTPSSAVSLEDDVLAIVVDGRVVSRAWSVRLNNRAEEIAVETHGDFRRRGYGKQVVAQWVRRTLDRGRIPIYSHRKGNLESQALALSLGAIPFVEVVSYH